ncbi:MAG: hypothetical protein ACI906_003673 [Candidatus Latescibacterota bacterium]|jgi:uncharacterized protein YjbI with pentapeptide repeats
MSSADNDYYIRLQTESHISATQWRQWSQVLSLEAQEIVDVWDEIGFPVFTATRHLPPISFVLQLRSERRQIDVFDFKDEVAPLIAFLDLLAKLKDDQLARGKVIANLFHFYRKRVSARAGSSFALTLLDQFTVELCKLILIVKVLDKENIALTDVLSMVARKGTPIEKVILLGLQSLKGRPYADVVRKCLAGPPSEEDMAALAKEDEEEEEEQEHYEEEEQENSTEEEGEEEEEEEEEEEDGEEDGEEEDGEEEEDSGELSAPPKKKKLTPMDRFISDFRVALETIYAVRAGTVEGEEAGQDRKMLNDRLTSISTFDPVNAIIPSSEEAQAIANKRGQTIDPQRVLRVRSAPPRISSTSGSSAKSASSSSTGSASGASASGASASGASASGASASGASASGASASGASASGASASGASASGASASGASASGASASGASASGASASGGAQISVNKIDSPPNSISETSKKIKTHSHDPFDDEPVDLQADAKEASADTNVDSTGTDQGAPPDAKQVETNEEEGSQETKSETPATLDKAALAAALTAGQEGEEGEGKNSEEKVKEEFQAPPEDVAQIIGATPADFSQKVQQFGQLLAAAERGEQVLWQLLLDPGREIEDRQALAAQLATANSPANQSFRLLRGVAQFVGLKKILQIPPQPPKNRKFSAVVTGLINLTQAGHKVLQPNDRQLEPLEVVLDHACACFWRLETLRLNYLLASQYPDQYSAEAVEEQRLKTAGGVAKQTNPEVLATPQAQAEADTLAMLELFSNETYTKALLGDTQLYAEELLAGQFLDSPQKLETALEENPLGFTHAEKAEPDAGDLPEDLLMSDEFGPVFQRTCNYISQCAWSVLWERHESKKIIPQVQSLLRATLSSCFQIQAEKRRHAMRPRMPISVVSLGKLSGNEEFNPYYARVGVDGKLLYVEGYEDGMHLDLMELREYTQVRMQASGQSGDQEGDDPLQTGENYLYTIGRTDQAFAAHASEVVESSVREEDGTIKIFPIFRPKTGR